MSARSKVKKMKIWALTLETVIRHSLCRMQSSNIILKMNVHDYLVDETISLTLAKFK